LAELRRHPVSGEWVIICPEACRIGSINSGDGCIYCPGNEARTGQEIYRRNGGGDSDSPGWQVRVVAESPPLFHIEGDFSKKAAGLCDRMEAIGAHEVVVESPSHDIEFEELDHSQITTILAVLKDRAVDLAKDPRLRQILISKVRTTGDAARAHPRWHIISTPFVPARSKAELKGCSEYFSYKERCVFCDYIRQEMRSDTRLICQNTHALAVSPYAARFPFEVWVLPLKHSPDFATASSVELTSFGGMLRKLARAMIRVPESRGYVIGIHTAPFRRPKPGAWKTIQLDYHWHIELRPRLDVRNGLKESGGFHLNPVLPEDAAKKLAELC
jgi:UDPglucose--hexose-1-phosphate uridylyltransferase